MFQCDLRVLPTCKPSLFQFLSHCMFMVIATSSVAHAHHSVPWQCPVPRPRRWRRGSACLAPRTGSPVWRASRRASRSPRQTAGRARAAPPSARGTSRRGLWPLSCVLWRAPPARPRPPPGRATAATSAGLEAAGSSSRGSGGALSGAGPLSPPGSAELPRAARRALRRRRRRRRARAPPRAGGVCISECETMPPHRRGRAVLRQAGVKQHVPRHGSGAAGVACKG